MERPAAVDNILRKARDRLAHRRVALEDPPARLARHPSPRHQVVAVTPPRPESPGCAGACDVGSCFPALSPITPAVAPAAAEATPDRGGQRTSEGDAADVAALRSAVAGERAATVLAAELEEAHAVAGRLLRERDDLRAEVTALKAAAPRAPWASPHRCTTTGPGESVFDVLELVATRHPELFRPRRL